MAARARKRRRPVASPVTVPVKATLEDSTTIAIRVSGWMATQMRDHPEVNWSEVCRRAIAKTIDELDIPF